MYEDINKPEDQEIFNQFRELQRDRIWAIAHVVYRINEEDEWQIDFQEFRQSLILLGGGFHEDYIIDYLEGEDFPNHGIDKEGMWFVEMFFYASPYDPIEGYELDLLVFEAKFVASLEQLEEERLQRQKDNEHFLL